MVATSEVLPQSVTESAQDKRHRVIVFTKERVIGTVGFTGPELRQALAFPPELTINMTEGELALLITSDDPNRFDVKVFPRNVGKVDLSEVIVDPKCQLVLLCKWYKDMYQSIQENNFNRAYRVFNRALPFLGVADPSSDLEPLHMFIATDPNSQVFSTFKNLQSLAYVIEKSLHYKSDREPPTLGFQLSNQFAHNLWDLIGTINPDTHHDLRNLGYAIETLSAPLAGTDFDAQG